MKAFNLDFESELYPKVALGYVASFAVKYPSRGKVPDLNSISAEQVRAFFTAPWPELELKVTMTDPAWLDHFEKFKPFAIEAFSRTKRPLKWEGPPRRAS
jgi:hypothetical protein